MFFARAASIANGEGRFCSVSCSAKANNPTETLHEKFSRYYRPGAPSECWPWAGTIDKDGYGVTSDGDKQLRAHRIAYALSHGPIPPGRQVLHTCDNPPCCNPKHLRVGTADDNNKDKARKGRAAKGEQISRIGMTAESVAQIRARRAAGETLRSLADSFCCSVPNVVSITTRRTWRHV